MPFTHVIRRWILIEKTCKPELVLALRDRIELNHGHAQVALIKAYLVPCGKVNPLEETNDCILAVEFNNAAGCRVNNAVNSTVIHAERLRSGAASLNININERVYFPLRESTLKRFHVRLRVLDGDGVRSRPLRLRQDVTIMIELAFRHLISIGDPIRECQKSMQSLVTFRPFSFETVSENATSVPVPVAFNNKKKASHPRKHLQESAIREEASCIRKRTQPEKLIAPYRAKTSKLITHSEMSSPVGTDNTLTTVLQRLLVALYRAKTPKLVSTDNTLTVLQRILIAALQTDDVHPLQLSAGCNIQGQEV